MSDTITTLPALTYGTPIRAASWNEITFAEVFTITGYAAENGYDVAAELQRATANGHALVGSTKSGASLVGDRALAQRMHEEASAIVRTAVTLKTGDRVTIDGIIHTVRFNVGNEGAYPRNSDPIAFDRVD
jgi:hypothetical protein